MPSVFKGQPFVQFKDVVAIPDVEHPDVTQIDFASICEQGDVAALERAYDELVKKASEDGKIYADHIIGDAYQQRENTLNQARAEAIKIKQDAQQEGYQQAYQECQAQVSQCIDEMRNGLADLYVQQEMFFDEYAANLASLAMEITGKIIATKIEDDDLVLTEMVKKAVNELRDSEWISVEVSARLPKLAEVLTKELRAKAQDYGTRRIDVTTSDSPMGTCVVQNEDGVVDASVQTQLENLITYFCEIE